MPRSTRTPTRGPVTALALAVVLSLTACSSAAPGPTQGSGAARTPGSTPAAEPATPGDEPDDDAGAPDPADDAAPVEWDLPDTPGYELSATQPMAGITQLESAHCIFQLVHEVIQDAGLGDSAYTDVALDNAQTMMGDVTETGRRESAIPTDAGPMDARESSMTLEAEGVTVDMRMLMRASVQDGVLVALTYVCPAGNHDEAEWDALVAGTTLHGTTATGY